MNKKYDVDFLILYEHKARELENCALMKFELERRGYSVVVKCIYGYSRVHYLPRVLVVPHLYNDEQVELFVQSDRGAITKVISLQYEQVLSIVAEESKVVFLEGKTINAYHLAWGEHQKEKYLEAGIREEHINMRCSLSMDFYLEQFDSYVTSKGELAQKNSLDISKKWVLFLSSYALPSFTQTQMDSYCRILPQNRDIYELESREQRILLEWIGEYCENNDIEFIYRPHPAENDNKIVQACENRYPNFHIIFDDSARAWVKAADICIVTKSTTIVDAFLAKKPHAIVKAVDIPEKFRAQIMLGTPAISSKEEFFRVLSKCGQEDVYRLNREMVKRYYGENHDEPSYIEMADWFEDILNCGDNFDYCPRKMPCKHKIKLKLLELCENIPMGKLFHWSKKYRQMFEDAEKEMYHFESDLERIEEKISKVLMNGDVSGSGK